MDEWSARKYRSGPMQYNRLTLAKWRMDISEVRLNLLVRCISPSRHPQADRGGGERRPGEPGEVFPLRPLQWENPQERDEVVALKVLAYFPWPESFFPEVL